MYKPGPPRRKLTNITRTRNGCYTCRQRRKRCDEAKPVCSACRRLGLQCQPPEPRFKFLHNTSTTMESHPKQKLAGHETSPLSDDQHPSSPRDDVIIAKERRHGHNKVTDAINPADHWQAHANRQPAAASSRNSDEEQVNTSICNIDTPLQQGFFAYALQNRLYFDLSLDIALYDMPQYSYLEEDDSFVADATQRLIADGLNFPSPPLSTESTSCQKVDSPDSISIFESDDLGASLTSVTDSSVDTSSYICEVNIEPSVDQGQKNCQGPHALPESQSPRAYPVVSQEKIYLRHWASELKDNLPRLFNDMFLRGDHQKFPALRSSILALSACNLSQTQPEVRQYVGRQSKISVYAPSEMHQQQGRKYYNKAIRELAAVADWKSNAINIFATLILFIYVESDLGSFRGLAFHHYGMERFLTSEYKTYLENDLGQQLIGVWTGLRARNWRLRIPFTVIGISKDLNALGIGLDQILTSSTTRTEAIVLNLVESLRLSLMIIFERYVGRGDLETICSRCTRDYHDRLNKPVVFLPWRATMPIPDEDYTSLLEVQRKNLDDWHSALPLSELPIESFTEATFCLDTANDLPQCPLRFHTHQAGMAYVYYVCTRILQSADCLKDLLCLVPPTINAETWNNSTTKWISILLRIVNGLDLESCAQYNFYTIGVLEVLYTCMLRVPRYFTILQKSIEDVVSRMNDMCISREGNLLIPNLLETLDDIEKERNQGNDIFFHISGCPETEWKSQNSGASKGAALVYGRARGTGKLFCKRVCED